ncbi:MAG TPA: PQQ-binding-like beta-propeller repeat protein, partial [Armatimonadota bacterium]
VHCSPCVADGAVMIAGCDGKVRTINLETGKQYAAATINGNIAASPAYGNGVVYVGTLTGQYLAVRTRDGKVLWTIDAKKADDTCYASAALYGAAAIFAAQSGKVFAVARDTGKPRWTFTAKSGVESSPVVAGDTIYFGSTDGTLYALNVTTGRKTWQFSAGAELKASPAVAAGRLVIGSGDGAIYCFGR